jgi:hypothetical protein
MGGPAAEQIIAGVVLSERLAVTPYGAIHRASWNGQHDLRGLVVDPKLLDDAAFRDALTKPAALEAVVKLSAPTIVPVIAIEAGGADVVVVTRGVGRYVTLQDLIVAARASKSGKLALPVAAFVGKCVTQALAAAHAAKLVHGAVHPRSVLVDEDGHVRLGDFGVAQALATAIAQGADASLWRGLSGTIAPELVVGEDPTPGCDVYAAGSLLFTMITGESPPGSLRSTPAVERLVQRALDTDPSRRYKHAGDLAENLLEAFEDDGWELAERTELLTVAGLSNSDSAIDDATEDLLASLGSASNAVQVTPIRPSVDIRAEVVAARHNKQPSTQNRLDALLADLDASSEAPPPPAARPKTRVPSLDDPDDDDDLDGHTPLPPPVPAHDDIPSSQVPALRRSASEVERDALDVLSDLEEPAAKPLPPPPVSRAEKPTVGPPPRAKRESQEDAPLPKAVAKSAPRPVAPVIDAPIMVDAPTPRLKSRLRGVIFLAIIGAAGGGFYYLYNQQKADKAAHEAEKIKKEKELADQAKRMNELQAVSGAIRVRSTPSDASVWLKLGRTPADSIGLPSSMMHELRIENLDGYQAIDTQVLPASWGAPKDKGGRVANVVVPLSPLQKDPKTKRPIVTSLPAMPPKPASATGYPEGRGSLHVESTPPGAEVWLLIGTTDSAELTGVEAGQSYELRVLKDGFRPGYISVSAEDWRDPKADPKEPLAVAKKREAVEKTVELTPEKGGR